MDKLTEEELAEFKDIYNLVDRYNHSTAFQIKFNFPSYWTKLNWNTI